MFNNAIKCCFIIILATINLAYADCVIGPISNNAVNFGSHPSHQVASNNFTASSLSFNWTCSGLQISILSANGSSIYYRALDDFSLTKSNPLSTNDTIAYILGSDSSFTYHLSAPNINYSEGSGFNLLSILLGQGNTLTIPLHFRSVSSTALLPPGNYQGTQRIEVKSRYCLANLLILCVLYNEANIVYNLNISLTVQSSCQIQTVDAVVDFGSHAFVDQITDRALTSSIQCSPHTDFKISISHGENYGGTPPSRRMRSAQGEFVNYHIFKPAPSNGLLLTTQKHSSLGTGSTTSYIFPIKISDTQLPVSAGDYTDNVQLSVEY